jgi:hypothetical protein
VAADRRAQHRSCQWKACQYSGLVVWIAAIIGTRTGPITDVGVVHELGRAHGVTLADARAIDANRGEYSIRVVDARDLDLSFAGYPRTASMWASRPPGAWAIELSDSVVWIEHGYGETPSPTWVGVRAEDLTEAIRAR